MNKAFSRIMNDGQEDYFSLNDFEQNIFLLASLINAVSDGDILNFYRKECGSYHEQLLVLLNALDLEEIAFVIDSVGAIFPDGYPPEDTDERLEIISELEEEYSDLFTEWTEEILEFISPLQLELDALISELEEDE